MAQEDLERLKEKVDKDPNSKLFFPLAEEYKKAGMLDEAIDVLMKGLNSQPDYMSARVSLGKIYLEKSMVNEARAEFEKVINSKPDNLFVHRKLAEIYRNLGERDKALEEFRMVLTLNPLDEDTVRTITEIEKELTVQSGITDTTFPILQEEQPSDVSLTEEVSDKEEVKAQEEGIKEGFKEIQEIENLEDTARETEKQREEMTSSFEDLLRESDLYIAQGKYTEAMDIYMKLLSIEPGNVSVLQRTEELKALMKLIGKDKEELIARLNNFLNGIRKRRDEVLKNL
jgi:tetratricopeptide (TPR) repeat protein